MMVVRIENTDIEVIRVSGAVDFLAKPFDAHTVGCCCRVSAY
jgi:hypothetical protein